VIVATTVSVAVSITDTVPLPLTFCLAT